MPLTHSKIHGYVQPLRLPIYVERVATGRHPALAWHDHDFTEIVIVLEGNGLSLVDEQQAAVAKGDVLVLQPGHVHAYDDIGTFGIVNICYHADKLPLPQLDAYAMPGFEDFFPLGKPRQTGRNLAAPLFHLNNQKLQAVLNLVDRLAQTLRTEHPGHSFLGMALFMEIVAGICEGQRTAMPQTSSEMSLRLAGLLGYIRSHFQEPLNVDDLARLSHTSSRTLYREFRAMTGYSPHEYQTRIRLQYAMSRLAEHRKPIEEIAREAGFCNGCHFTRHFKQAYGKTPLEYRREHR